MSRAEAIYNYKLYSFSQVNKFSKYAWMTATELSKQYNRNKLFLWMDMLWCNFRYGAMDTHEYLLYDFYHKSHKERSTYFTRRMYYRLIKSFDFATFKRLEEKDNQYKEYSPFIKRRWMVVDENTNESDIIDFIAQLKTVVVKPVSSDSGVGIFKIYYEDKEKINFLLKEIGKKKYIIEETLQNCKELHILNPNSLNTVRVTYVLDKNGNPIIFNVMLRTAIDSNAVVDNWGAGGILLEIDKNSGTILKPGLDELNNKYSEHPISKVCFIGFQIPRFKEMLLFAIKVAKHNKKVVNGGIDIAITDNGFDLVEINFPPANIGYQVFGKGALDKIRLMNN